MLIKDFIRVSLLIIVIVTLIFSFWRIYETQNNILKNQQAIDKVMSYLKKSEHSHEEILKLLREK